MTVPLNTGTVKGGMVAGVEPGGAGRDELTIDELARQAGTTVRNVRGYQERGLVPPPRRDGRRGLYDQEHLRRVRLVLSMLDRGYPLTAIRELVEAWADQRSLSDVLGFGAALAAPFTTEAPATISLEELAAAVPGGGPEALSRAVELGILTPAGDRFTIPSPSVFWAGVQLMRDGIPAAAVMDSAAAVLAGTDALAARFVALFVDHVWQPFVEAGMPGGDLARITGVLERMRPLAEQVVTAALAQALQRHSDAATAAGAGQVWPGAGAPPGAEPAARRARSRSSEESTSAAAAPRSTTASASGSSRRAASPPSAGPSAASRRASGPAR